MKKLLLAGGVCLGLALALAGCSNGAATVDSDTATAVSTFSNVVADANSALTVAEATLAAYEKTANPSAAVITEATKLDTQAHAAITQYGPDASTAIAAAGALAEYLLTSAPGNGVTPSTVPTSS